LSHLRFNVGLQSAILNFRSRNIMRKKEMVTNEGNTTPSAADRPNAGRRRNPFVRLLISLLRPVRRTLVGHIETQINEFQTYQSDLLINVHLKLDEAHIKLDEARIKIDETCSRLEALEDVRDRVNQLSQHMDEIGLRIRSPIQVDESTFSLRIYDGFVFVPRTDTLLLLLLLDAGPQGLEPGTRTILKKLLAPGMTFIDVGAHIGLLTLAGARAVENSGKVYALEPTSRGFELLNRALVVNGLTSRVVARCQAAGARRERSKFYVGRVIGHSSLHPSPELSSYGVEPIDVEVIPLDEVIPAGERADVVKIDVEGGELAVLQGMTRIINEHRDLVIIAEFGSSHLKAAGITSAQWFAAFYEFGFDAFAIDELTSACRPVGPSDMETISSVNILFGRPASPILARVFG
jgi:FkbM family methyltransferase